MVPRSGMSEATRTRASGTREDSNQRANGVSDRGSNLSRPTSFWTQYVRRDSDEYTDHLQSDRITNKQQNG